MKQLLRTLYNHIDLAILVLLLIAFTLGIYSMFTKIGGPVIMDYVVQAVLGVIIIGDIIFLVNERKKEKHE